MRVCDLTTSTTRLQRATSKLRERWLAAKEHWNDGTNARFERDFLDPLSPQVTATLAALYEFAESLQQAEKECGDERSLE
ncbi:MAG: hypothetical protein KDA55_05430 [Planctomycetales bacterium]|nr:hypothetical protein [Planctomycetales bacterium]MCA9201583.1 hypothetical protein [Planctomycetales bacterium]MCA9207774.1 hypothetical protein [Planctomycetales bacterium]MCA9222935.1 hypothetical protein [Planctomycetales bacterium]